MYYRLQVGGALLGLGVISAAATGSFFEEPHTPPTASFYGVSDPSEFASAIGFDELSPGAVPDEPSIELIPPLPPLESSGQVIVEDDGAVIENLHIRVSGTDDGIRVLNAQDVMIRNVVIEYEQGRGIQIIGGARVAVEDARIYNRIAPSRGAHVGVNPAYRVNLYATGTKGLKIEGFYGERGSSAIYLHKVEKPKLERIEGFDVRGPLPRGQLVQFDRCLEPLLDTFTLINPGETAWTEDGVNSYGSIRPVIRNGYIDGINSPSGIGVIIENSVGGYGGSVSDVDVRHWVNGAFMAALKASDVTFRNVRALDGLAPASLSDNAGRRSSDGSPTPTLEEWAGDNYRGGAKSGQEAFFAYGAARPASISYLKATYVNLPRRNRIAWNRDLMSHTVFRKRHRATSEIFRYPHR